MKPGFTLLEVMIAVGIFALFLVPLLQTQMLAGQAIMRMQERREAVALATARLDEVQHQSGVADSVTVDHGYQIAVTSVHMTGATLPLTRIQVQVTFNQQPLATVASYRM